MQVVQVIFGTRLRVLTSPIAARSVCLSCGDMDKYAVREGRTFAKVMRSAPRKKKYWSSFENNSALHPMQVANPHGGKSAKRVAVLNKLFMKNITGLMATGEVAAEILGKGIEISKVKVTPDFNLVNVYWCAKGTESDVGIENTLQSVAGELRHELSQLRVMGVVPKIQFVKDKHYSKTAEVERLLQIADFGEEHVPPEDSSLFQSEFTESSLITQRVQDKADPQDDTLDEDEHFSDMDLPVMRMDVLGLDHSGIMTKIKRSMKKAKASHRLEEDVEKPMASVVSASDTEQSFEYLSAKQRKQELNKFLLQRKSVKDKARRHVQSDTEMFESVVSQSCSSNQFLDDAMEEQDFIEEDDYDLERH